MSKRHLLAVSAFALTLGLAACAEEKASEETAAPEPGTEEVDAGELSISDSEPMKTQDPMDAGASRPFKTYDAAAFFETTTAALAPGAFYPFSPDGSKILVSWDKTGIFNAYALPLDGSDPVMLSSSTDNAVTGESYFPGSERILFSFDQGGNELDHIWVREEDGTTRDLTPGENVKASFAGWKADGSVFYIMSNERDPRAFDLYAYDAGSYERSVVYQNDDAMQVGAISRDGRWLALVKPRTSADSNLYLLDLSAEGAAPQLITEHEGNISYGVYDFTPDGTKLVYATNEHGEFNQAWTYDLASGEKAEYYTATWDVSFVSFSASGNYRVTGVNNDARTEVEVTDLATGEDLALPPLPEGSLANIRFSPDDKMMAFRLTSDTAPANVYVVNFEDNSIRQLTDTKNPEIDEDDLVPSEVVRYESFDGLEIPSILYRPHQATPDTPVPALVWVHGGPGGQSRTGYSATIQHLVNHGYAVLAANNRGSSGYGKTFFHMDDRKHGEVDLQDIVYGKKYLEGLNWVDGEKIGIIGGSYGGYMVVAALAFEPEVFDVGIDIFGVTNWERTLTSIPPWWEAFKEALYDEMGDPATDGERHRRISPLFHAENIKVPLLVVQGANDPRVLQVESDEMVEAVRANGVPVEYVVFPDEGHGFQKRENRITASDAYVKFLDTYLSGAEE